MSLGNIFAGVKAALTGGDPADHMDMSRAAFPKSFYALIVAGLLLIVSSFLQAGSAPALPIAAVVVILFLLTAPTVIYMTCHLISRTDIFRPWVIIRNWLILFLSFDALLICAVSGAGLLPAQLTMTLLMLLYVGTLLVDIRLAQTMAKMEWTPAIFIACAIAIAGMLVLLAIAASLAGY